MERFHISSSELRQKGSGWGVECIQHLTALHLCHSKCLYPVVMQYCACAHGYVCLCATMCLSKYVVKKWEVTSFSEVPHRLQDLHSMHCQRYVLTAAVMFTVNCRQDGWPGCTHTHTRTRAHARTKHNTCPHVFHYHFLCFCATVTSPSVHLSVRPSVCLVWEQVIFQMWCKFTFIALY